MREVSRRLLTFQSYLSRYLAQLSKRWSESLYIAIVCNILVASQYAKQEAF